MTRRKRFAGVAAAASGVGQAGMVTGSPTLTGRIPVTGTVEPYATVTLADCVFGVLPTPTGSANCASTVRIATNSDLSVRWAATTMTDGLGHRLLTSYQVTPAAGGAQTVDPDTNRTAQIFQAAAPLDTVAQYQVTGTAQYDSASTIAGTYQAMLQLTMISAATDLSAPTGLAVRSGDGQLTATWNAVGGAASYELAYQAGTEFDPNAATIVAETGTSRVLTGLTNGQTYTLAVRSVFGGTKSGWSATVQGTPQAAAANFYRDARDFAGQITSIPSTSCSSFWWVSYPGWDYHPYGASYATARGLWGSGYLGTTTISTTITALASRTYTLWLHMGQQTNRPIEFCHDGTCRIVTPTVFSPDPGEPPRRWVMMISPFQFVNGRPITMRAPSSPNDSYVGIYVTGIALTSSRNQPPFTPTGYGGDTAW